MVVALVALVAGAPAGALMWVTATALILLAVTMMVDVVAAARAWEAAPPTMTRQLPGAFAVGVRRPVTLTLAAAGPRAWHCDLFDFADPSLETVGLPQTVTLEPGIQLHAQYFATPTRRGNVSFSPAAVRVRSRLGLAELRLSIGGHDSRRVYPDFAQVSRFAWLTGRHRLQEIGIKTYQRRGEGTDFKQLSEYRVGDAIRHIDWRATLRLDKPIVREFQDDRDQAVVLLIDCGRRMRAEEGAAASKGGHFDHVLNAVMLMTYVALKHGDAVGAMTFGTAAADERAFPPRKGSRVLHALMSGLYDVQPSVTHADYLAAAQRVLAAQPSRALIVLITNFRDEDSEELQHALRLLRSRHLVLVASMRERVIGDLMRQPLDSADAAIRVASAHLYEQSRRDAFRRLAARDGLMVDALPERLGVELVNRYQAAKSSGLI